MDGGRGCCRLILAAQNDGRRQNPSPAPRKCGSAFSARTSVAACPQAARTHGPRSLEPRRRETAIPPPASFTSTPLCSSVRFHVRRLPISILRAASKPFTFTNSTAIMAAVKTSPPHSSASSASSPENTAPEQVQAPTQKRKGGRKPVYATQEERKMRNRAAQAGR